MTDDHEAFEGLPAHRVTIELLGGTLLVALPFWYLYSRKNSRQK